MRLRGGWLYLAGSFLEVLVASKKKPVEGAPVVEVTVDAPPAAQPFAQQPYAEPFAPQPYPTPGAPPPGAPGYAQPYPQQPPYAPQQAPYAPQQAYGQPYPPQPYLPQGPPYAPGMSTGAMPGMMPGMNPMMGMLQMMQGMQQMMMGGGGAPMLDSTSIPFALPAMTPDQDPGLDADIIRPARLESRLKTQRALSLGCVLDSLCLTEDGQHALGGIPEGCTIAFVGPPGRGKTRSALAGMARAAVAGRRVAFVVAEEGFHDDVDSGRDDLCSRLMKVGMLATGLDEAAFEKQVLDNLYVLEAQYHRQQSWDDFVGKYRYLVEKAEIDFVVVDSLNMIDPSRKGTADNLSALKTYNHEKGVTCLCIGQIKDTGEPVGGEAMQHSADAVFLLEEMGLASKEQAEFWGGKYRERITLLHAVKSVTTPTLPFPVRVDRAPGTGELIVHAAQPSEYRLRPTR